MPEALSWNNFEDIGIALYERFPDIDPLTVRFTDLRKWVHRTRRL
jgi:FeS assembly protein IscX